MLTVIDLILAHKSSELKILFLSSIFVQQEKGGGQSWFNFNFLSLYKPSLISFCLHMEFTKILSW